MPATTPAIEDYLKTIYAHTEWQPDPITPSALAGKLGIAPSSVTEMVKKLAALGLVTHVPYGAVRLNDLGTARALEVVRRHRLIETWLVEGFGYSWDEVHDEAEVLEHAMSDRLLDAIDEKLGHPTRDPHGDPIPTALGGVSRPEAVLLRDATPGTVGRVVRISDSDPRLLRHLTAEAITIDRKLEVVGRTPYGGSFTVRVDGTNGERDLGEQALASIWIAVELPAQ
jgi:DtxR family Mn-dependent transcriptional regulator